MRSLSSFFIGFLLLLHICAPSNAFAQTLASSDSLSYEASDTANENADADSLPEQRSFSDGGRYFHTPQPRNTASPTAAQWDSLTANKDFSYRNEREYNQAKEPYKPPHIPGWIRAIIAFLHFFTTTAGLIILFIALAAIVFFIVYSMMNGGGIFARKNKAVGIEEKVLELSEEDLLQSNWEDKMRAAMQAGDYRLAIRFGYLLMLQLLQRSDLIIYRQDKTNMDYYRELAATREPLRPQFRRLTLAYEWAWYGGRQSTQRDVETYFQTFNDLKSGIQ